MRKLSCNTLVALNGLLHLAAKYYVHKDKMFISSTIIFSYNNALNNMLSDHSSDRTSPEVNKIPSFALPSQKAMSLSRAKSISACMRELP